MYQYIDLCPWFQAQASWNSHKFLRDKSFRSIFCPNAVTLGAREGWWSRKAKPRLESLAFSATDVGEAGSGVKNRSCRREVTSKNPQSTGFGEFPDEWTHLHREGPAPQLPGDRGSRTQDPPHVGLHLYPLLYPFITWWTCFLEFRELLQQITESKEKVWDPPICSPVGQSWGSPGDLLFPLASEVGWEQPCGTEPVTCEVWPCLQVDGVTIEVNCRAPGWCSGEFFHVGEIPIRLVTRNVLCKHFVTGDTRQRKTTGGGKLGFPCSGRLEFYSNTHVNCKIQ